MAQAIGGQSLPSGAPPSGLSSAPLGPGLIAYSLPAPGPGLQTNGVASTTLPGQGGGTEPAVLENLSLTLSAAEHPLATAILNAFVDNEDRDVCSANGSSPLAEWPTTPRPLRGVRALVECILGDALGIVALVGERQPPESIVQ